MPSGLDVETLQFDNIDYGRSQSTIAVHLWCDGDGQADSQVVDSQLQEEGAERLSWGLLNAWQFVNYFFCGHVDVLVEGHTLLIPVVICCLIIEPEKHSCRRGHNGENFKLDPEYHVKKIN